MKYIVIIIAFGLLTITSQSQGLFSLRYPVSVGLSKTGDYIGNASFRGLTCDFRGFVSDNISVGGYLNWTTFYEKLGGATFTDGTATLTATQFRYLNAFPMLVQGHYYTGTDDMEPRVYFGAGLGTYKMIQRVDIGVWSLEENHWHFGMSPEVGLLYPVGMESYLNLNLKYHYVLGADDTIDFSWIGISIGFAWGY